MLLAINTGQRQGDLLRLPWSAYDGTVIKLRQRKTGAYVPIPVADALKDALDTAPRAKPDHVDQQRSQTVERKRISGRVGQGRHARRHSRLTFHDLRGTAVVTLARAGCNEVEIYSITGHKPGDVQAILTAHYLPRDAEVAKQCDCEVELVKPRGDQRQDKNLPTMLPTVLKIANVKPEKA